MSLLARRLVALACLVLVACRADAPEGPRSQGSTTPRSPVSQEEPTPHPLLGPRQLIRVIPRDAITSIDDPAFEPPTEIHWLAEREPVVSLEIDGDARAYPLQILTWHEIVNDTVGGTPVAVTYCPLCNSAVVYKRRIEGEVLDFGTSGMLYESALVMYDRQTETLWTHFDGLAVRGSLTGTRLEIVPAQILSFAQWLATHPDGKVLSRSTGEARDYGTNPYPFYDSREGPNPELFIGGWDRRLSALSRVVGVTVAEESMAYPYRALTSEAGAAAISDRLGGRRLVIFWQTGVSSALDEPGIAKARDVGTSGVFVPQARGRSLSFTVEDGRIVDRETGSTWSVAGRATAGPLAGETLEPVPHLDSFWFAWQAYVPETLIHGVDD